LDCLGSAGLALCGTGLRVVYIALWYRFVIGVSDIVLIKSAVSSKLVAMRVIAGTLRGRQLQAPAGLDTRPILDRVKASLFDWLGARLALPGQLPAINVCDLFCGGGTHGIEAISRGAAHCTFVEQGKPAIDCLRKNLAALGIERQCTVVQRAVGAGHLRPPGGSGFGLVFFDPPYALSRQTDPDSMIMHTLDSLSEALPVTDDALLTWRSGSEAHLPDALPGNWARIDTRTWNRMTIALYGQPNA